MGEVGGFTKSVLLFHRKDVDAPVFKSKKAKAVYEIIRTLPPQSDEQARQMIDAVERVTGRRHPFRPMKRTTEKAAEEVMGIPHAYWDELLVEMDTLKTLYVKARALPPNKRKQVHKALLDSLTHLLGHVQVMYDDAKL